MNKLVLVRFLVIFVVFSSGCIDATQNYNNINIGYDVVSVTRIHENDNIRYSVIYIDPDCNCNKEIHSGKNTANDGRDVFINIFEKSSTKTRLTIESVIGNSKIISSNLLLETTNNTMITDEYR